MIIDGRKIAGEIYNKVAERVATLPFVPVFCDVLVGTDPVSAQYVRMKARQAEKVGMQFLKAEFSDSISAENLAMEITKLNSHPNLCGLIVQLPLPKGIMATEVLNSINPNIDVDCLNSVNTDLLYSGRHKFIPPTPGSVLEILNTVIKFSTGQNVVVVGKGDLVGKPVTYLLRQMGFSVQVIDRSVKNPELLAKQADILVTAAGRPGLITSRWVKQGAIVIDAGTADTSGGIVGDVDLASVEKVAGFISPVPGGVGPVTVAKLLENVVIVAETKLV